MTTQTCHPPDCRQFRIRLAGLFLAKNVLSSCGKDYKTKPLSEFRANQTLVAVAAADACYMTRKAKNEAKDRELAALEKKIADKEISKEKLAKERKKHKHSLLFSDFPAPTQTLGRYSTTGFSTS